MWCFRRTIGTTASAWRSSAFAWDGVAQSHASRSVSAVYGLRSGTVGPVMDGHVAPLEGTCDAVRVMLKMNEGPRSIGVVPRLPARRLCGVPVAPAGGPGLKHNG